MVLVTLICLSHTPPIRLARGVFIFHLIQSVCLLSRTFCILMWLISFTTLDSSLSPPTSLLLLSYLMDLMLPLLLIKSLQGSMKESVYILFIISIWIA